MKANIGSPRVVEVIICTEPRGKGTEEDPCRTVTRVYTKEGEFIAEDDPGVVPQPRDIVEH